MCDLELGKLSKLSKLSNLNDINALRDIDEIMQNQAVINVGLVGHVANGKTSVTEYMTGIKTNKHSAEKKQNKTIRLGYANFKIWKCPKCNSYESSSSDVFRVECDCVSSVSSNSESNTQTLKKLVNHISIVDCPGHNTLMSTMLNGSSVMDFTILVESATNTECPAPQTAEHFKATKMARIPNAMILMNKMDIAKRSVIESKMTSIENYVRTETNTTQDQQISPIIPVSATFGTNLDIVCEYLSRLKIPMSRDSTGIFEMLVVRSFDVNKPGITLCNNYSNDNNNDNNNVNNNVQKVKDDITDVRSLKGGVIGGSIVRGRLNVGDRLVILPGRYSRLTQDQKKQKNTEADFAYEPIRCLAKSIQSEKNDMSSAIAGGLLAIQVSIDPSYTRNDGLTGSIVLKEEDYMRSDLKSSYLVYDKVIVKITDIMVSQKHISSKFKKDTVIKINVNSNTIKAMILKYSPKTGELRLFLVKPIPITQLNNYVTIMLDNLNDKQIETDIDCGTVLCAGQIVDGIQAFINE